MKRIALYARKSVERPDSVSIAAQIEKCRQVSPPGLPFEEYIDEGFSGKSLSRPAFEKMLSGIRAGEISHVVSYRLDRISRSITDFASLLAFFEEYGIKYLSATESFDTSSPVGRAMVYIVMVFAQLERETIAERIADNYRFRAGLGRFTGGNAPFGYRPVKCILDGKKASVLSPSEDAPALFEIFGRYVDKKESAADIAAALNERAQSGKKWTAARIKRILQNISPCENSPDIYEYLKKAGVRIENPPEDFDSRHGMALFCKFQNKNKKTPVSIQSAAVGRHEPLIPAALFLAAQKKLEREKEIKAPRRTSLRSFLSGLVFCKECRRPFTIRRVKGRYEYFCCLGRREKKSLCENALYLPAKELEALVLSYCRAHLIKVFENASPAALFPPSEKESGRLFSLREELSRYAESLGKGGALFDEALREKINRASEEIALLEKNAALSPAAGNGAFSAALKREIPPFLKLDGKRQKELLCRLVARIDISREGGLTITFLF